VHLSYGERYPASHRNNVLQLFRRDGTRSCDAAPRLCEWAAGDRLNAVQLELGVPLRWPGPLRQAFTQALTETFAPEDRAAGNHRRGRARAVVPTDERNAGTTPHVGAHEGSASHSKSPSSTMLLAYDVRAQLGFMSGVSMQPDGRLGGRLLIFSHTQTMALFTGEDAAPRGTVIGGPVFATHDGGTDLSFSGNVLEVRDAAAYVRLEHAFMQSRLIDADLKLSFTPTHDDAFGRIHGTVRLDGTTHHVDTFGFRDVPIFLRRAAVAATRCSVAVSFRGELGLHATTTDDDAMDWTFHLPQRTKSIPGTTHVGEQRHPGSPAPGRLILDGVRMLVVHPLSYMQIHRPLPNGSGEMIFLGLASCGLDSGSAALGFYEYVRPADQVSGDRPAENRQT
jgi:hypothetical protein